MLIKYGLAGPSEFFAVSEFIESSQSKLLQGQAIGGSDTEYLQSVLSNQFVDTCTVDASVTKYARAKRTRRSGRYFYEPRVSGGAQSQQGLTLSWDSPRK